MAVRATCIVCALAALAASTANAALPQRTFVASTGNDGSPCTLALPCRSFGVAIAHAGLGERSSLSTPLGTAQ